MKLPIPHKLIDNIEHKQCSKCNNYKSLDKFAYAKNTWDNLYSSCKLCKNAIRDYFPKKEPDKLIDGIMCRLCSYCNQWKDKSLFVPSERQCLDCKHNYNTNYYANNKLALNETNSQYYKEHKNDIYATHKIWVEENKDYVAEQQKEYRDKNKDKLRAYHRNKQKRYRKDPIRRMAVNLRRRVILALQGNPKSSTTFKLVGCDIGTLKSHLENLFKNGMSWQNYGEWHIDHIIPCASFDLSKEEEQKKCFHYTNLQPLWAKDNLTKGKKIS